MPSKNTFIKINQQNNEVKPPIPGLGCEGLEWDGRGSRFNSMGKK